jgi:2'-5' RNA ligase
MRLFTAIDLPAGVRATLEELIRRWKPVARIQWSPAANLHITTKFIGEWPADRLTTLTGVLASISKTVPLDIAIRGLGWFPTPHSPRVFFAGISAPGLAELAAATDAACASIGIPPETKKFTPHLTLARIKTPEPLQDLRRAVSELDSVDFGQFTASSQFLYESTPGSGGSVYRKLEEFPLT